MAATGEERGGPALPCGAGRRAERPLVMGIISFANASPPMAAGSRGLDAASAGHFAGQKDELTSNECQSQKTSVGIAAGGHLSLYVVSESMRMMRIEPIRA